MTKSENEYIQACLRVIEKNLKENEVQKALTDVKWLIEKLKDS